MSDSSGCSVRFELLGPLRAWREDVSINLGPVQQRVVLAVLLLQQNRLIGRQQLVNAVWGEAEPRYAANLLHRHVSGLRSVLGLGRNFAAASGRLAWMDGGYLLTVPAGGVDLELFDQEVDRARQARAARDLAAATGLLRGALARWRGPVCDGLSSPFLDAQRERLNERRINVVEECIELDLTVGGRVDLLTELRQLVAEYPFRENLHGLLMLALYRSGRRADALAAFQDVRHLLRKELGVEPAARLQRLHQQILTADPELAAPAHEELAPGGASLTGSGPLISSQPPTPAQLPHSTPGFSNRDAEIRWLNGLLADHGPNQGPDLSQAGEIVAITGTAGVGKTTLAVHWAHRVRDRFPDGQLYVNLRGFDPAGPPMEPSQAIRALLDAFAVPPDRFPVDLDAQAALYRTMLADRQMLIVLDNARDADQVRPLLPGTPSSLVIVTSRNQLLSLIAADGARPLEPDLLSADQARRLLAGRLGPRRVAADPAAMDEIIDACAGLPLALSMVGARAAASSRLPLAELAEELRETRGQLYALVGQDPRTDLRAVFSWSYQALSAAAARLFRLIGLHAGPEIGVSAAASLAGLGVPEVRTLLAELTSAHLVTDCGRGRFAFHDLLRVYASELAAAHDPAEERREAIRRVLDYYLHTAYRADELLRPSRVDKLLRPNRDDAIVLTPVAPPVRPDDPGDHRKALAWFATEYQALLSAVRQAASNGFDVHTWQLAWALESFFGRRGHWHEAAAAQRAALDAANRLGDPYAQARSQGCLAYAYIRLGRYGDAHAHLLQALEFYEQLQDLIGQAHAHRSMSWVLDREGSYQEALSHALQAAELFQAAGHRAGQARALNAIGWFHIQLGDPHGGLVHCRQALCLQREIDDQFGQADTLDSIAAGYRGLGHYQEAIAYYKQALDLYCEFGDRYDEADVLACLGDTHLADGVPASAGAAWGRALTILDELGHPDAAQVRKKLDRLADAANRRGLSS
jgi:DNA-binding SARP family transcriptional activator/tetratricopeptide (TPR) repeat protein